MPRARCRGSRPPRGRRLHRGGGSRRRRGGRRSASAAGTRTAGAASSATGRTLRRRGTRGGGGTRIKFVVLLCLASFSRRGLQRRVVSPLAKRRASSTIYCRRSAPTRPATPQHGWVLVRGGLRGEFQSGKSGLLLDGEYCEADYSVIAAPAPRRTQHAAAAPDGTSPPSASARHLAAPAYTPRPTRPAPAPKRRSNGAV